MEDQRASNGKGREEEKKGGREGGREEGREGGREEGREEERRKEEGGRRKEGKNSTISYWLLAA